jgi:SAM-dependent methyltransferase
MNRRPDKKSDIEHSLIFDEYFEKYNKLMQKNLWIVAPTGNISYFPEHKMSIFKNILPRRPETILEYGCGIGNNLPYIRKQFPGIPVWGCDTSQKSLDVAREHYPEINFFLISDQVTDELTFDCILVADVIHHIPYHQRNFFLKRIENYLGSAGNLVIFEHNPYNPLTRFFVNTCPFDMNTELISLRKMCNLLTDHNLTILKSQYCFYFPEFLSFLDRFEYMLSGLPFGGKYCILAVKK